MRGISNRPTDTQISWQIGKLMNKTSKNLKKATLPVVIAGPLDTESLYYPLDVKSVTLKDSLLPAHIR